MGQSHSQSQTHISVLPNEIMFIILEYLSSQEMKSAVLVCKSLREMGEKPRFWTWAAITVNTKDDLLKLKWPRLQMVHEIDLTQGTGVECPWMEEEGLADLFQVIGEIPTVRRIRGLEFCKGIGRIEPYLVVSVLNSLEELHLCYDGYEEEEEMEEETHLRLTVEQLELLFTAVAEKTNLKFLRLSGQDTQEISPELFAAAVSNVEEVELENKYNIKLVDITDEHFKALYSVIAAEEDRPMRKLTTLDYFDDETTIDPNLLSRAYNRLEEVTTDNCWFDWGSDEQVTAILRGLVEGESRLKRLKMNIFDLVVVQNLDQNLVRRAEEKFEKFQYT